MRSTIFKLFFAWDYEKEEKWLNDMSQKGLQLVSPGFCKYVFEKSAKDEYTYRLELLENLPTNHHSTEYIRFLEETGVEYIGSVFRWAYFRKKAAHGPFEIYSDIESRIKHYKRILLLFIGVTPANLSAFFINLNSYIEKELMVNLVFCIIASILILLLGMGIVKVSMQILKLKREKLIRE